MQVGALERSGQGPKGPPVRALLIIDVQNDFIDGSLAVPDAKSIIPVINKLRSKKFDYIYQCLDWHPFNHCSFRTNNPGSNVFQVIHLPSTGDAQIMWPDHCVQGTHGAEIHKDLKIEASDIFTYAGCNPQRDSYSVFKDNGSTQLTDMRDLLEENHVTEIYAVGLATDFCVQYTVLDAKILLSGVEVFFVEDGCRGINDDSISSAMTKFEFEKIHVIASEGPEIKALEDRKLNLNGSLQLTKRAVGWSDTPYEDVDEIYESIVFDGIDIDMARIEACIEKGLINQLCSWSCKNILHAACETGNVELVTFLLERAKDTIDITVRSKKDENALMLSVGCPHKASRLHLVELLMDAANDEQQRKLLFGQTAQHKMTALMLACRRGDCDMVELLLSFDATMQHLSIQSAFGKTALMYACMTDSGEHAAVVEVLLRSRRCVDDRIALLSHRDYEAWTSLHFTAKSGCFAGVDWSRCLDGYENLSQLPVNEITNSGITFLHLAAFNGKSEVIRAVLDSTQPDKKKKKNLLNAILKRGLRHRIKVNVKVRSTGDTELDLALQRRHLECARLLLRLGCHAGTASSQALHELLHRLVLMGDVEACEYLLNFADENNITVDETLVEMAQRMEHPETCTFSFASYNNTVHQFFYKCNFCEQRVCLVCKDRCHGIQSCRAGHTKLDIEHTPDKDWTFVGIKNAHCECNRERCCATPATDLRELEGYRYIPNPISTTSTRINAELSQLSKRIARNTHNVWAQAKIESGWQYGRDKDENSKQHPYLLPFSSLSYEGAKYNMDIAVETIKVILALGYKIQKTGMADGIMSPTDGLDELEEEKESESPKKKKNLFISAVADLKNKRSESVIEMLLKGPPQDEVDPYRPKKHRRLLPIGGDQRGGSKYAEIAWRPELPECRVLDTQNIAIPSDISGLVKMIAANNHEVWASEKIRQGFRYAPARNIKKGLNLNSSLVPYEYLTDHEKQTLLHGAKETIKVILSYGWVIQPPENQNLNSSDGSEFSDGDQESYLLKRIQGRKASIDNHAKRNFAFRQLKQIRRKLFNQFLFAAVRRGQINSVNILLSKRTSMHAGANLNAIDEFGHTPLYIAIKRGHFETARRLLHLGANVEIRDINGLTPLALCAYLGNLKLCQELVQNSARILVVDNMGFTPLHHAANQGHTEVCRYLTERLQQENQANEVVDLNVNIRGLLATDAWTTQDPSRNKPKGRRTSISAPEASKAGVGQISVVRLLKASMSKKTFSKINPLDIGAIVPQSEDGLASSARTPKQSSRSKPSDRFSTPRLSHRSVNTEQNMSQHNLNVGFEAIAELKLTAFSPLSLAVKSNNIDVVALLIKFGGNPMQADGKKGSGTMFSPYVRALFRHIEMTEKVEYLKEQISRRVMLDLHGRGGNAATKRGILNNNKKSAPKVAAMLGSADDVRLHNDTGNEGNDFFRQPRGVLAPFGNRLKLMRKADSRLTNFFGFQGRAEEKIHSGLSTRELDEMLEKVQGELEQAVKMVEVLNESSKVRTWRKKCAIKMFMRETFTLLLMIFVFGLTIQLAPDYDLAAERIWDEAMTEYFESLLTGLESPAAYLDKVGKELITEKIVPLGSKSMFLQHNIVFGRIKLKSYSHVAMEAGFENFAADVDIDLSENVECYDFAPSEKGRFEEFSKEILSKEGIQQLSVDLNMYNSFFDVYAAVSLDFEASFTGVPSTQVRVLPFRLRYKRFPPSRSFQLVLGVMVGVYSFSKIKAFFSRRRKVGKTAEWITAILLCGVLIYDLYLFEKTRGVPDPLEDSSDSFNSCTSELDLQNVHRLLEIERRAFAVFFLLSVIPLLNAARTIPSIGPVVVALLNTMGHPAVLIYLLVVATSCFLLTLTFHVGFGSTTAALGTPYSTFESLFLTPFIETWSDIQDTQSQGFLGAVLTIFYILFATITINLLIAIVTDVYPNCRRASDQLWEQIITQGIEDSLKDSVHDNITKRSALHIECWNEEILLAGKDGVKHWKPCSEKEEKAHARDSELSALRAQIRELSELVQKLVSPSE